MMHHVALLVLSLQSLWAYHSPCYQLNSLGIVCHEEVFRLVSHACACVNIKHDGVVKHNYQVFSRYATTHVSMSTPACA